MGVLAATLAFPAAASAQEPKLKRSFELSVEGRVFFDSPAWPRQSGSGLSVAAEAEFDRALGQGVSLRFRPFARWDQRDTERSHVDVRELALQLRHGSLDTVVGISRVFWGVTESVHLVDTINQTDLLENPDGEDKLGQPMVSLMWSTRVGNVTGFVLPYFRERTLPGEHGRFRAPLPYDRGEPLFESARRQRHVDWALRYALTAGALDLGLSHFRGTGREPRFVVSNSVRGPMLTPVYDLVERNGLDISAVRGAWLWKLEAVQHRDRTQDYAATAAGFEYTRSGAFGSGWDAGWLLEWTWDERGDSGSSALQNDLFLGTRWSGNDVAGTELLAGAAVDLDHRGVFATIEASRRVGESGKLTLEARLFDSRSVSDPLHALARDDYLQLLYTRFW